ncbi:hypothetical protein BKG76_22625 [Mycobacteroides franklinii]|uniref:Uncharacterized protein n=1 Tax=Mycobacteroides franklinii TaxID=948102 RepID=A0A1S1L5W5_9MYCO|nr:hypothetical protein BKG76_22625 [Mycobacteroides franklinii]
MLTGSHHEPLSQFSGVVETGGRQVLAAGSHHPPGQSGTMGSAALITGEMPDIAAIGNIAAAATTIARRALIFM